MSQILFHRISGTRLYRTTIEQSDVKLLFYVPVGAPEPPTGPLMLETAWDDPLKVIGYLLFPNRLPSSGGYVEFEKSLAEHLPPTPPTHTSFAWAQVSISGLVTSATPLPMAAELPGPVVADEFFLDLFPPLENLLIAKGTPVTAGINSEGFIERFVVEYPAQPSAQAANGIGIEIAMSGPGLGCLRFEGLYNIMTAKAEGDSAVKDLYRVSIDPVDLFSDSRTYMLLTGLRFLLRRDAAGVYSIQPL